MIQITTRLEASLLCSIGQYQQISDLLNSLSGLGDSSEDEIKDYADRLFKIQELAQQNDAELIELLRDVAPSISDHPLYLQRKALIEDVLKLNHLLLPKINGMMALISHELSGLQNGCAVLGGYKQTTHKQGRLVKSSA